MDILTLRLEHTFPTNIIQDQQLLEKRSTLNDPQKFLALAYRISEKKLLDSARRRCEFLKQSISEVFGNASQEINKKKSKSKIILDNKEII